MWNLLEIEHPPDQQTKPKGIRMYISLQIKPKQNLLRENKKYHVNSISNNPYMYT